MVKIGGKRLSHKAEICALQVNWYSPVGSILIISQLLLGIIIACVENDAYIFDIRCKL